MVVTTMNDHEHNMAMIIVWAIAIYRKASLPRLIAMQRRVLAETMIKAHNILVAYYPIPIFPASRIFVACSLDRGSLC